MVKGVPHGVVLDLLGGTWTDESMMAAAIRRAPAVLIFEVDDAANNRSGSIGTLSIAHFVRWDQRHSEEKRPRVQKIFLCQFQAGLPWRYVVDASRERVEACFEALRFNFFDNLRKVGVRDCGDVLLGSTLPHTLGEKLLPVELEFPMARQVTLLFSLLHTFFVLLQSLAETLASRAQRLKAKLTEARLHL